MRTMTRFSVWMAAVLFLAAAAVPAAEAQYRRSWGANAGVVDLTDEQFDRIQDLRLAFQDEIRSLETKWSKLDLELDRMSRKGQNLDAKLKELDSLELEMDKKWEEHQAQVRSLLTDDQKVLFDRFGGLGLGAGWGPGGDIGLDPRRGLRMGAGRGLGYGRSPGLGRASRGYGRYRGYGRGYYSPWRRW